MKDKDKLRKAKLLYSLGAAIVFAYSSFTLIRSSPTVLQCNFERWLSEVEQQLWRGEHPWQRQQELTVMLATDSHRFKCCGPIDSDTRRERLIRVLSLIREARLIRSGAQSDVAPMIEIELGDKLLFRSNFKSSSIKAALLINLMRIYEEIETSSP